MEYKTIRINWNGDAAGELAILKEAFPGYSERELVEIAIDALYDQHVKGELDLVRKN